MVDSDALLKEVVLGATGSSPESFRKANGTFDTAAFNAGFKKRLEEGRASKAGSFDAFGSSSSPRLGVDTIGSRERDDGKEGSSAAKVGGSSAAAKDFMRSVSAAEGMAERREPYRVFPFPHAPAFVPARFGDDTESLDARVSAVYRTVFGDAPDAPTRKFLSERLRTWDGDTKRLSNLVSTMHTMASAEAQRRRTTRDAAVAGVVKALSEGVAEKDARAAAENRIAEGDLEEARLSEELLKSVAAKDPATGSGSGEGEGAGQAKRGGRLGERAVYEIAGITSSLLTLMESNGVPADEAERDVETSLNDWRDAQISIAEAMNAPRRAEDAYADARDHGAIVASRHFQNPAVGM